MYGDLIKLDDFKPESDETFVSISGSDLGLMVSNAGRVIKKIKYKLNQRHSDPNNLMFVYVYRFGMGNSGYYAVSTKINGNGGIADGIGRLAIKNFINGMTGGMQRFKIKVFLLI